MMEADRILLTAGAVNRPPSIPGLVEDGVEAIGELLRLGTLPARVIYLGASPTTVVFAQALQRMQVKGTLWVESEYLMPHLLDR